MRIGIAGISGRMGRLLAEESRAAGHEVVGGTVRAAPRPRRGPRYAHCRRWPGPRTSSSTSPTPAPYPATQRSSPAPARPGCSAPAACPPATRPPWTRRRARIPIVYAANFGPGVNLLLALARQLGAALPAEQYDAEIIEMHHRQKVDAPSGTAIALGRAVADGRGVRLEDVMQSGRDGHTGPRPPGAIGFAALRGGQVVGEHTLLFAAAGEHIALTHRALDRRAFATGAVRAAEWARGRPPGRYSMVDVMGPTA